MTATEGLAQVNELATSYAFTAWNAASDFLIIIILFGILFLFAWYIGRATLVSVLLAFYAAYALYVAFPYASFLPTAPAMTALLSHIGLYAALSLVFYIILRRVVVSDFLICGHIRDHHTFIPRRHVSYRTRLPRIPRSRRLSLHSRH